MPPPGPLPRFDSVPSFCARALALGSLAVHWSAFKIPTCWSFLYIHQVSVSLAFVHQLVRYQVLI